MADSDFARKGYRTVSSTFGPNLSKTGEVVKGSDILNKQAFADMTTTTANWYSPELTSETWLLPKLASGLTPVLLADGTTKTLGELYKDNARNFEVVSWNGKGFDKQFAHSVQLHGKDVQFTKIIFSDDSFIECAKEHAFYLSSGEKVETRYLKVGDEILTYNESEILTVKQLKNGSIGDGYDAVNITNNYNYVVLTSSCKKILTANSRQEILKWQNCSKQCLTLDGIFNSDELVDNMKVVTICNDSEVIKQIKRGKFKGDIVNLKVRNLNNLPLSFTFGHPIMILRDGGNMDGRSKSGHGNILNKFVGELIGDCITVPVENVTTRDWVVIPKFNEERTLPLIDLGKYVKDLIRYEVKEDCLIYKSKNIKYSRYIKWAPEFFNFLGWYAAEGYSRNTISLSLNTDETVIAHELGKYIVENYGGNYNVKSVKNSSAITLNINNRSLAKFLIESFGHSAISKKLPDWLMYASKENTEAFLKGWLAGDGTILKDRVRGVTASRRMGGQLFWLFTKLGVMPFLSLEQPPKPNMYKGVKITGTQPYYISISVFGKDVERFGGKSVTEDTVARAKYLKDEFYFYVPVSEVVYEYKETDTYDFLTSDTLTALPILNSNCKTLGDLITEVKPEEIRALNIEQQILGANGKFTPLANKEMRKYTGEICKIHIDGLTDIEVTDAKVLLGIKTVRGYWDKEQHNEFINAIVRKEYPTDKYLTWITASLLKADDILVIPKNKEFGTEVFDLVNYIPVGIHKQWFYNVTPTHIEFNAKRLNVEFKLPRYISTDNKHFIELIGAYLSGGFCSDNQLGFSKDVTNIIKELNIPIELFKKGQHNLYYLKFPLLGIMFNSLFGTGTLNDKQIPIWLLKLSKENSNILLNSIFENSTNKRHTDNIWCNSEVANKLYLIGLNSGKALARHNSEREKVVCISKQSIPHLLEDDSFIYVKVKYVNIEKVVDKKLVELTTIDHTVALPVVGHNCRIFFNLDSYCNSILMMHAYYPFSKFDISTSDKSITDFYKDMAFNENFDLYQFILQASISYEKFGEACLFGNIEEIKEGAWQGKKRWKKFILLEPELVEIKQNAFESEPTYEMIATQEMKDMVRNTDTASQERKSKIPQVIVDAVMAGKNIPLESKAVSTIQRLTDPSATRGTPPLQSVFKILIFQDKIRQAQMAAADRYHFPVELWTLGDVANGILPSETDLQNARDMINQAVQSPPFSLVYPPILKYEALGVNGKLLNVKDDYDYIQDQIMVGLGVNKNIITGDGPSMSNLKAMSLQKLVMMYKTKRDVFENWIINKFFRPIAIDNDFSYYVGKEKKYILPQISWYKSLDIEEENAERDAIVKLHEGGYVSTKTLFAKFPNLDYDTEKKNLEEELDSVWDKKNDRIPREFVAGQATPEAAGGSENPNIAIPQLPSPGGAGGTISSPSEKPGEGGGAESTNIPPAPEGIGGPSEGIPPATEAPKL